MLLLFFIPLFCRREQGGVWVYHIVFSTDQPFPHILSFAIYFAMDVVGLLVLPTSSSGASGPSTIRVHSKGQQGQK